MRFNILAKNARGAEKTFVYDNQTGGLYFENGNRVPTLAMRSKPRFDRTYTAPTLSKTAPAGKDDAGIRTLKIQLGLSCNYACDYCSQRFVPRAGESSIKNVEPFLKSLDKWLKSTPQRIEFWGGEPLVYIKTLKPLAEALRKKYPNAQFVMITNGSLLTLKLNEWIERMGFSIAVSHDGPGQFVRGPDPMDDPEKREAILDLYRRIAPLQRMSFNSMIHSRNLDRAAIQRFFIELTGDPNVPIGEGAFIEAYDEGGMGNSMKSSDDKLALRRMTLEHLRENVIGNFLVVQNRLTEWIDSFAHLRPAKVLGMKCGMDRKDTIAVELSGNVLTCQNVSSVSSAPNGESHKIGHVDDFKNIAMKTSTHWSERTGCSACPMLQLCKGSCMFLEGDLFWQSCENSYSDHVPFFAYAVEQATGYLPYRIDAGHLPEMRRDIWGTSPELSDPNRPRVVPRKVA